MLPRTVRNWQDNPALNAPRDNNEPQPFTVAQIVGQTSTSNNGQATLEQLLQEILNGDQRGATEAIELGLEVNYRLIYIIVRGGLQVLSSNPVEDQKELISQAINSLAVIDLKIRHAPAVLFCIPENDAENEPGGPIFLWLLPHLINLLDHEVDNEIRKGAAKALETCISAQVKPSTTIRCSQPVQVYLQGCIQGKDGFRNRMETF